MKKIILLFSVLFLVLLSACRTEVTETLISNDYTMENTELSETVSEYTYPSYDVIVPEPSFVTPAPPPVPPPPYNNIVSSKTEKTWGVPHYPFERAHNETRREPGVTGTEVPYSVVALHDDNSPFDYRRPSGVIYISSVKDIDALCDRYIKGKYTHKYDQVFFEEKVVLFLPLPRSIQGGYIMENTEIYSIVKNGNEICVNFTTNLLIPKNNDDRSRSPRDYEITVNKSDIKGITQYRSNYIVLSQDFSFPF